MVRLVPHIPISEIGGLISGPILVLGPNNFEARTQEIGLDLRLISGHQSLKSVCEERLLHCNGVTGPRKGVTSVCVYWQIASKRINCDNPGEQRPAVPPKVSGVCEVLHHHRNLDLRPVQNEMRVIWIPTLFPECVVSKWARRWRATCWR